MSRSWFKERGPRPLETSVEVVRTNNHHQHLFVPPIKEDLSVVRDNEEVGFGIYERRQSAPTGPRPQYDVVLDPKHSNLVSKSYIPEEALRTRRASTSDIEVKKREEPLYPSVRMVTCIPEIDLERVFGETDFCKKKLHSLQMIDRRTLSGRSLSTRQNSFQSFCSFRSSSQRSLSSVRSTSQRFRFLADDLSISKEKAAAAASATSTELAMSKLEAKIASSSPIQSFDSQYEVEVTPGVFLQLRGSAETWQAIRLNRITNTRCICCCTCLHCVQDAEYVICPDCRVVSPVYSNLSEDYKIGGRNSGGVGLGFKPEDMAKWQAELAWHQQQPQQQPSPQPPRQLHWVSSARY